MAMNEADRLEPNCADEVTSSLFGTASQRAALGREAEAYVSRSLLMMHRARRLVVMDQSGSASLLNSQRATLGAHFVRYQRFKHGQIFDPVIRLGPSSSKIVARSMKVDCMQLGHEFTEYSNRWLRLTEREWSSYRADMLATTEKLEIHLESELRAMRQLLMVSAFYSGHVPHLGV